MNNFFTRLMILLVSIFFNSIAFAVTPGTVSSNASFSPQQVEEIQKVIHDYLLQNPQVIVEVLQKLQQQQQEAMEKQAVNAIQTNQQALFNNPNSPVAGNVDGGVTMVEFFDYQCPHCKVMAPLVQKLIKDNKNLKVVFKEFPIFPGSMYAAQAALAAAKQGKYLALHNALMADKNPLSKNDMIEAAKEVGLNLSQLENDINSPAVKDELANNLNLAEKIGLAGTPAFIIQNNKDHAKTFFIPGQVDEDTLEETIRKAS